MLKANDGDADAVGSSELDFVTQQLALATYKSKSPSTREALDAGLQIIEKLDPDDSNDTETLGIAGAIRKRLWDDDKNRTHLDKAIKYYGRGFNILRDYYNGENYALCLDIRSDLQENKEDSLYDAMTAKRVRKDIVEELQKEFASDQYQDRSDKLWMNATMANSLLALGKGDEYLKYEERFMKLAEAEWQRETYEQGKQKVLARLQADQD